MVPGRFHPSQSPMISTCALRLAGLCQTWSPQARPAAAAGGSDEQPADADPDAGTASEAARISVRADAEPPYDDRGDDDAGWRARPFPPRLDTSVTHEV